MSGSKRKAGRFAAAATVLIGAAGKKVFTAPVHQAGSNGLTPCESEHELLRLLCLGLRTSVEAIIDDIGQTATEELTNDYLATWNPLQTIGKCPVTGIAGTFVSLPDSPYPYYVPDDGLVGEASALARSAKDIDEHTIPAPPIPNFRVGGTYPSSTAPR